MSRQSVLLAALGDEPVSTSALYERVGYPALVRVGLVAYNAFRDELDKLVGAGLAERETAEDGATVWRLKTTPDSPSLQPGGYPRSD